MRIIDLIHRGGPFVSLEFFPPKDPAKWPDFFRDVETLASVNPLFVSVTYGAMGSTRDSSLEIVSRLKNDFGLETMAHLTCIGASAENLDAFLDALVSAGVDNVLALRGDIPAGLERGSCCSDEFRCAADLVAYIRVRCPELGIGVAAYPEAHPESPGPEEDLVFLKLKLDQGADFAITQLFFDNEIYRGFLRRARANGVDKPIIPGVMPIFNLGNVERIISLCGASIPQEYMERLRDAQRRGGPAEVMRLGVAHAQEQARDLLEKGAPGVHLYTLNRAKACVELVSGLGL
jgi:methylenetetrahydrofolate reductase (NADPH)